MDLNIKVNLRMIKSMEWELIIGKLQIVHMLDSGKKNKLMDMENTLGKMEELMQVNGKIIICVEKVYINGQTEANIQANSKMI